MKRAAALIAILFWLSSTACSPSIVYRDRFIRAEVPPIPAEPTYYWTSWLRLVPTDDSTTLYCLDLDEGKNLAKNIILMRSYAQELRSALEGLQDTKEE